MRRYIIAASDRESKVVPGADATRSDDWYVIGDTDTRDEAETLATQLQHDPDVAPSLKAR
jgi:hypothetical protein